MGDDSCKTPITMDPDEPGCLKVCNIHSMTDRSGNNETVGSKAGELNSRQMHIAAKHLNRAALGWKPGEMGENLDHASKQCKNGRGPWERKDRGMEEHGQTAWETCSC